MNLNNILIMIGDFNIRDHDWNPSYLYHSIHEDTLREIVDKDTLREIVDSLNLELLSSIVQVSTYYLNNPQDLNSVLDLMFLYANVEEFNNYIILPDLWIFLTTIFY